MVLAISSDRHSRAGGNPKALLILKLWVGTPLLQEGLGEVLPSALSCLGSPPPRGSFFILDDKETNNQGLDLMSDKFVKALLVVSTSPR